MPNGFLNKILNNQQPIDNTAVKKLPIPQFVPANKKVLSVISTKPTTPVPIPKEIAISDNRPVDAVSGTPLSNNNNLGSYANTEVVKDIVAAAKKNNIDPYTALAMGLQETGLTGYGDNEENVFHVLNNDNSFYGKTPAETTANAIKLMANKFALGRSIGKKDEASIIQAWNGYGKVGKNTEGQQSKMYGIDVSKTPIDMNANPVYGKRIIDLRENVIKKNPQIVQLVNSL